MLIALNASSYRVGVFDRRLAAARRAGLAVAYVNAVGGQDDPVFCGQSFVADPARGGDPIARSLAFEEWVETVDLGGVNLALRRQASQPLPLILSRERSAWPNLEPQWSIDPEARFLDFFPDGPL